MSSTIHGVLLAYIALGQALSLGVQSDSLQHGLLKHRVDKHARTVEVPVYNNIDKQHISINISIGTPPQQFSLLADSGSAFLWVPSASSPACTPNCPLPVWNPNASTTATPTHSIFNVSYGLTPDNIMLGDFYNDTVSIGDLALPQHPVAFVEVVPAIYDAQTWGIVGLGSELQNRLLDGSKMVNGSVVLWEHLYRQGYIDHRLFSVWLNSQDATEGTILFGGVDESKAQGGLKSTPLTSIVSTPDRDGFADWSVNLMSLRRRDGETGEDENIMNTTYSVILDTGSPNMYVPQALYDTIAAPLNVTLRTYRNTSYVPCSLRSSPNSLHFGFAGKDGAEEPQIRVPYSEIVYPFGMPANLGEVRSEDGTELCYLGVLPNGGSVFLLGTSFIRSAYVVFDAEGLEVRMGQARWE